MILGGNREAVIENIKEHVQRGALNEKAELDDPIVSDEERMELIEKFLHQKQDPKYASNNRLANTIANYYGKLINRHTKIVGLDKIKDIRHGAIITSNHFNQLDSTIIKKMVAQKDGHALYTVIEETNLAMDGFFGFLMNYCDNIPISVNYDYMRQGFSDQLKQVLNHDDYVLIYPEQEMWFNYRKPRPCKRGAYYYASQLGVPVISCFTQIDDLDKIDSDPFKEVRYTLHILDVLYPDPNKSARINSIEMAEADFALRKKAYEEIYHKPYDQEFNYEDIAGYIRHDA
jgi:1-acyl-sn-glycerol-3-phosphate acyltransferase